MDDIQKRSDDKSWDQKQDRRISDANRKVEAGVSGEALATLHGLHVPSDDEPPCDVDETSELDDQEVLPRQDPQAIDPDRGCDFAS
jgi:hypothetical protein